MGRADGKRLAWVLGLLCACVVAVPVAGATDPAAGVLVLGRISDDPQRHHAQLKPLLDYVVPRMAEVGIREGRILMARDAQQMQSHLRHGRVDWVSETPAAAVTLRDRAGARVLLANERDGQRAYRTLLIVRRDQGIASTVDLRGRRFAFERPGSTSAYVVAAVMLLDAGLNLEALISPSDSPGADALGYVFARTAFNIVNWVDKGIVDAGALSNLDWEQLHRDAPDAVASLQVIAESTSFPRGLELVRSGLDPAVEARLRELLLQAAGDPEAAPALRAFFGTTGFVEVDADMLTQLDGLQLALARVRDALE